MCFEAFQGLGPVQIDSARQIVYTGCGIILRDALGVDFEAKTEFFQARMHEFIEHQHDSEDIRQQSAHMLHLWTSGFLLEDLRQTNKTH